MSPLMEAMMSENECVRFANNQRGYVRFDLTPKELRADFRVVEYVIEARLADQDARVICRRGRQARRPGGLTDPRPFFFERVVRGGLPRAPIPVAGVPEIPFLSMKVGVNPRPGFVLDFLRNRMRSAPVSLRVFPHRPECRREVSGRSQLRERRAKLFESHLFS